MTTHGAAMRVLIADDSAILRQRMATQLAQDPGVAVVAEAGDTQETLAMIEAERPDAVVLDLSMPGGGGIAVLEALRGRRSPPAVVVLTNHVLEEYRERCLGLGASAFLDKSADAVSVIQALRDVVRPPAGPPTAPMAEPPMAEPPVASAGSGETVEMLPVPIAILDGAATILVANRAWQEFMGSWSAGLSFAPGANYLADLQAAAARFGAGFAPLERQVRDALGGRCDAFSVIIPCPPGGALPWMRVDGRRTGANGTTRLLLLKKVVSEEGRVRDQVRATGLIHESLAEHVPDILFRYRLWPDQAFEYVSPAVTRITGYTPEDVHADPAILDAVVHPDDQAIVEEARREAHALRKPLEVRLFRKDGEMVWLDVRISYVRDAERRVVAAEGVARDVTERKRMEDSLRRKEAEVSLLLERSPDPVAVLAGDGTLISVNRATEEIVGAARERLIGRRIQELPGWAAGTDDVLARVLSVATTGQPADQEELQFTRRDGRQVVLDVRALPIEIEGQLRVVTVSRDMTVRKNAERVMRLQSAALDAAANGVVITDREGRIEWVNPAFSRLTGYGAAEAMGRTPRFLKSGHQDDAFYTEMWNTITAGRTWRGELVNRRKDGTLYPEEMHLTPVRDSTGAITHFIGIKEDVSERNAALASLRYSEGRFRAVADSASDAIIVADGEGRIVYWNRAAVESFGYDVRALHELRFTDLIPEATSVVEFAQTAHTGEVPSSGPVLEVMAYRRDGSAFPVELTVSRSWKQDDRRFFSAVVRDLTERRQAEAALRESEARFRGTFEQAAVGIAHLDMEGRYLRANQRLADMLGYSVDELLTMRFQDVTAPDDLADSVALRDELAAGKRDMARLEKRYLRKDGRQLWAMLTVSAARDATGVVRHLITVVEDVTAQQQLREQLHQAQKMEAVGRLAGGVAHDFNNLLTIIRGEAELALEDVREATPLRESLVEIKKASDRAAILTGRLLAFSRKQIVEKRVLGLNALVADAETMLRRLLEASIRIELDLQAEHDLVDADPSQLEQVLVNLVVNARDAMPHGGTLTVMTRTVQLDEEYVAAHPGASAGPHVLLAVSDTGIGMDDDVKRHLFEPFFTTKPRGQGTGLGLATCFGIVKQSGGYVGVYSEPDIGTTMNVFLPRASGTPAVEAEPAPRAGPAGHETVLIVEDEEPVRRIARRLLTQHGYSVLEAKSAEDGLALLETVSEPVHLLLSDVVLPGLGGRELAARAQQLRPDLRVLFMTGYTDDAHLRRLLEDQRVAVIHKPFHRDTLLEKVRQVLNQADAHAGLQA
jgi:PAS domain S-box-containing protein